MPLNNKQAHLLKEMQTYAQDMQIKLMRSHLLDFFFTEQ